MVSWDLILYVVFVVTKELGHFCRKVCVCVGS